jgi:hypothetical protein
MSARFPKRAAPFVLLGCLTLASAVPAQALAPYGQRPGPAYPTTAVLGAFSEACKPQASMAALADAARKQGWTAFTPTPDSPMARGIGMIGAPLAGGGPDPQAVATFRREVAGRPTELLFVHYGDGGYGCMVSDYAADRPIDAGVIAKWAGRAPLADVAPEPVADDPRMPSNLMPISAEWRPGVIDGSRRTFVVFTPTGSFFNSGGMVGISLLSQWDEAKEAQ